MTQSLNTKKKEIAKGYKELAKGFKRVSNGFKNPAYTTPDREKSAKIYEEVSITLEGIAKRYPV